MGTFDVINGNSWLDGGSSPNFVFPENLDTFIPDHALVPGNLPVDTYTDLPYPQTPDGGTPNYNDPSSNPNPAGVAFNSVITRITRSGYDHPEYQGANILNSEVCYFNKDGSYLYGKDWDTDIVGANKSGGSFLFDGVTGQRLRKICTDNAATNAAFTMDRFRWYKLTTANGNVVDPNLTFAYLETTGLYIYKLIDDAPGYQEVTHYSPAGYTDFFPAGGEGDLSKDGTYWVIGANRTADGKDVLFAINLNTGAKGADSNFTRNYSDVDYAVISASGAYIIVAWHSSYDGPNDTAIEKGIEVYDRATFTRIRTVTPGIIHFAVVAGNNNEDWIVCPRSNNHNEVLWNYHQFSPKLGDIIMIRVDSDTTESWNNKTLIDYRVRCLMKKGVTWISTTFSHSSGDNSDQYLYVSTWKFGSAGWQVPEDNPAVNHWYPLVGEIIAVPILNELYNAWFHPFARRICHTRPRQTYYNGVNKLIEKNAQPDFTINRQGTKIAFVSCMGQNARDIFMVDLSANNPYTNWNPGSDYSDPIEYPQPIEPQDETPSQSGDPGGGTGEGGVKIQPKVTLKLFSKSESKYLDDKNTVKLTVGGTEMIAENMRDGLGNFVVEVSTGSGAGEVNVDGVDDATLTDQIDVITDDILD